MVPKKQSPLSVGILVHNPPFQGGIVQYCILLANELKKYVAVSAVGFKKLYPPFFYKGKLPKENKSGIQFETPLASFITWYNPLSWVKAYFSLSKNDLIHIQWVSPLLAPLQYVILTLNKFFAKKPVIATCHNIEPHESTFLDKILTKLVFKQINHFIVHAFQNKKRLHTHYHIPLSHIHVVPHGTFEFFKQWSDHKSQKDLKEEFHLENKKVILFFGYIREYKGLLYLLRALPEVLKKNKEVILLVAGELWQPLEIYEQELSKLGIRESVVLFPFYISDREVHRYFEVADLVVLPYFNTEQTISGPLLVSLAFGKPLIISLVGGIGEIIKEGINGLLVEGGNNSQLSQKIDFLLNNPALQKKLSQEALKTNEHYKWENVAKDIYQVYQKALED